VGTKQSEGQVGEVEEKRERAILEEVKGQRTAPWWERGTHRWDEGAREKR
jgi:hypothetical protein